MKITEIIDKRVVIEHTFLGHIIKQLVDIDNITIQTSSTSDDLVVTKEIEKALSDKVYDYLKGQINIEMTLHQNVYRFYDGNLPSKFFILHDDVIYKCVFILSETGGVVLEIDKGYGHPIAQILNQFEELQEYMICDKDKTHLKDIIGKMSKITKDY